MPHACPDVLRSPSAGKTRILLVCLPLLIDRPDIHCPPPICLILSSDWSSYLLIVTRASDFCPELQTELLSLL